MDDDALTSLLTASSVALGKLIAGDAQVESSWLVLNAELIPSKSVGVEGTGSASQIDRRMGESLEEQLGEKRHATSVNAFLRDRQSRLTSLVEGLVKFSMLHIESLEQTDVSGQVGRRRSIKIDGNFARLFALKIQLHVVEEDATSSPQIQDLQVDIPDWLRTTLDTPHNLYTKLISRNDLPAILLMFRTMVPLLSLRRNLFTSLMESYTDLARDHVRAWEHTHSTDFTPFHPHTSSSTHNTRKQILDPSTSKSLIHPTAASTFTLKNKSSASLTFHFDIRWNRFGHAYPDITATPSIPPSSSTPTSTAFLQSFHDEFAHLLKTSIAQNPIIGLPDKDNDDDDDDDEAHEVEVGRWGVSAAVHATIRAFFRIDEDEAESEDE
ncbi:hypothetical protein PHSY_004338 [Pseudozyma hubeiensis SY62]|uniref:Uncharacterized protein n=1 Tax=Pseudozyma hubeiensis (strain SY62) TaxID=1305764 RepID=R9P5Z7_PSEHS|nr:hypothetical protein PHSY_004338 [Pseudozyma hubeiensis SY62]GAC96754.1 hypothetical protein PHSY_004338 [Pseudozyma hubeiensis SY62]